jgi:hypothetical protein
VEVLNESSQSQGYAEISSRFDDEGRFHRPRWEQMNGEIRPKLPRLGPNFQTSIDS